MGDTGVQNLDRDQLPKEPDAAPIAVTVVVPCRNERQCLPTLFDRLVELECDVADRYDIRVLFVDDGSTDGTWPALREASLERSNWSVLKHETNRGIAAAIMTGIRAAETETVCTIDADCTYEPALLAEMIPLLAGDVDLVTASPYHPHGSVDGGSGWRTVLSKCCSRAYRAVLRNKLCTYTSCFRVYRRSAILPLVLRASGFVGITEMVVRLDALGSKITEYPATLSVRTTGTSKLRVLPTALGHVKLLVAATCSRARKPERPLNSTHQHVAESPLERPL